MARPDPGPVPGDLTPWTARSTRPLRAKRGLTGRCPRCGGGDLKASFLDLKDACPHCNWTFEREEGYWLGAMVVLFASVEALYLAFLLIGILAWWPDVRWNVLLYAGLAMNAIVPVLLYRWSRTAWLGLHTAFFSAELESDAASRQGIG
jgi:uncharacterized protein (DUF983 family)